MRDFKISILELSVVDISLALWQHVSQLSGDIILTDNEL